jgi:hypothetical protein
MHQPACHGTYTAPAVDGEDKRSLDLLSKAGAEKTGGSGNDHQDSCQCAGQTKNFDHGHLSLMITVIFLQIDVSNNFINYNRNRLIYEAK